MMFCVSEKPPPKELVMVMKTYLDQLKSDTAEACHLRDVAKTKRSPVDPRIVSEVPLKQQVQEYLLSQPPIMRDKPIFLMSLRAQLQGRYNARPSAGDLGIALTALGFIRVRDYTINGGAGRRYWVHSSPRGADWEVPS
jgi:hypothetical protein